MVKKSSYASLKKKLDKVFSEYIRRRDESKGCISCGAKHPWKQMQAGHYISRVHLSTRWDELNVHAQCMACNVWRRGNGASYTLALTRAYGPRIIEDLVGLGRVQVKYSRADLIEKIEACKLKLSLLAQTSPELRA